MLEHFFQCPYCWETVSMLLDVSTSETYVEDCEVCCNPMQISTHFDDGELIHFEVENLDQ